MSGTHRRRSKTVLLLLLAMPVVVVALVVSSVLALTGGQQQASERGSSARSHVRPTPPPRITRDPAPACTGTVLTPASDVQAAIDHAPPGTTFCFGRGTYQLSAALIPKSGDVLDGGQWGAVLAGGNGARFAIYGDSALPGPSDVTVRGFVIRDFDTPLQLGAIQDWNGPGWIIQDNHITENAAAGVATGDNVRVIGNLIDHNGQEGFTAHGNGGLYQDNEIAYNNENLAVAPTWEAGGGKASRTRNLTFKSNYVHNNGGPGLWVDTNNIYTTFDGNTITNNWGPGIYEEISYDATIINNTLTGNGMPSSPGEGQRQGWAWDAGIELRASGGTSASSPLVISHNIVRDNYNGITLIQSPNPYACGDNGEGQYGPCRVQNVIVEDNDITMTRGATGGFQDGRPADNSIFVSWHNQWLNNNYCVPAVQPNDGYMGNWLAWMNRGISWPAWQNYGLDKGGAFSISTACG
jgi:parallel beta-helix repeat protein